MSTLSPLSSRPQALQGLQAEVYAEPATELMFDYFNTGRVGLAERRPR